MLNAPLSGGLTASFHMRTRLVERCDLWHLSPVGDEDIVSFLSHPSLLKNSLSAMSISTRICQPLNGDVSGWSFWSSCLAG